MENSDLIPYILLGLIVYFFIMYLVVSAAVRAGSKSQNYNLKMQNRLMIKLLMREGVSRKEIVDLHNQDNDEFWKSIPETPEERLPRFAR